MAQRERSEKRQRARARSESSLPENQAAQSSPLSTKKQLSPQFEKPTDSHRIALPDRRDQMVRDFQKSSPLGLYPYQIAWIDDSSPRKIADKSRRIGFSFAEGLDNVIACHERERHHVIVLSKSARLSQEFITESVVPHCRAMGISADYLQGTLPGTSIVKNEVAFGNNSWIRAFPANPDTARSYEGDVVLDEFAFHKQARKIAEAIIPSITRGFRLKIISTPNGQVGSYYDLALEAGLVDGIVRSKKYSAHKVDLLSAIRQGCADKYGHVLNAREIKDACLDEEMWLQEYMCAFLSTARQWISPELFTKCVSDFATVDFDREAVYGNLYGGWDIARNKDLSVLWLTELIDDITTCRGVIEFRNVPTPEQSREANAIMRLCQRMAIDKTGMGLAICEALEERWGGQIEGITFTQQSKELLAVHGKRQMEAGKTRIPDDDMIRNSFRSVQKSVTATGMSRFDAEHDEKIGHADHWWAYCLAEHAAGQPMMLGAVKYLQQQAEEMKRSQLAKPMTNFKTPECPKCGAKIVVKSGKGFHCNQCGEDFKTGVDKDFVHPQNQRRDLVK